MTTDIQQPLIESPAVAAYLALVKEHPEIMLSADAHRAVATAAMLLARPLGATLYDAIDDVGFAFDVAVTQEQPIPAADEGEPEPAEGEPTIH